MCSVAPEKPKETFRKLGMSTDNDLLKAIADAGGLDPIAVLRDLTALTSPERFLDLDGGLLSMVIEQLRSEMNDADARVIKETLWDARLVVLAAADVSAQEKTSRLAALDQIGLKLFPPLDGRVCHVEVRTIDLVDALHALEAAQRGGTVRISFRDGNLELARSRALVRVPAAGSWPLTAVVPNGLVSELLARHGGFPQRFIVSGSSSMLHFSHFSIRCLWAGATERT